jgi:hypothetical protein
MTNQHGTPIWYELITSDVAAAEAFYGHVIGWTIADSGVPNMDYRIVTAEDSEAVAGMMARPAEMPAPPLWLFYLGVDDVDAAVEKIQAAGGSLHMPAMDVPTVGRMAMVADPQGAPFYVMRGASDEATTAYGRMSIGHGSWHELITTDPAGAIAFYGGQFGYAKEGAMPMGPDAEYAFLKHGEGIIGAVMPTGSMEDGCWRQDPEGKPSWHFYFRVADIDSARERVLAGGGQVVHGPMEVPGGEWAMNCVDPQGIAFGLVAPAKS